MFEKLSPYHSIERYVNFIFWQAGLKSKLYEQVGLRLQYWDSGSDKPILVMLPAFAADTKYSWFRQVRKLSRHYRLLIPNLLYFGKSSLEPKSYSIYDQVNALKSWLNHLQIREFSIVSASYGAVIAAELAKANPSQVTKMVMTNAPYFFDGGEAHQRVLKEYNLQKKSDLLVPKDPQELKRLFQLTYYRQPFFPDFLFRDIYRKLYHNQASDKVRLIDTCIDELENIQVDTYRFEFPVLLLWGREDKLVTVQTGEMLAEHLGTSARLVVLDKTAHMPNFERPRIYNKHLIDFLKQ